MPIRVIAVVLLAAFLANDIAWAYPDILDSARNNNSNLQIQSVVKYPSDKFLIEDTVKKYCLVFGDSLPKIRLTLTPEINGKKIEIGFDPKNINGDNYQIPCRIGDKRFTATLDMKTGKVPVEENGRDFDAFHKDPEEWKKRTVGETRLGAMDLPEVPGVFDTAPKPTDMAGSKQTVEELVSILTKEGLQSNAYEAAAQALVHIAIYKPELIQPSTVQALEGILTKEGLKSGAYQASADALSDIARYKPELVQSSTVQALEGILTKEGLEIGVYRAAAGALSDIAKNKPELFAQVYSVIQRLMGSDKRKQVDMFKAVFTKNLPESVNISLITNIQPEAWTIILNATSLQT